MVNITKDVSNITTIPYATLGKLHDLEISCICHAVQESNLLKGNLTSMDIGIGTLYIKNTEDEIKYKFIPSNKLETSVTEVVRTGKSPLISKVESTLKDRIMNVYKELL